MRYDVVWYWANEEWLAMCAGDDRGIEVIFRELELDGFVAYRGLKRIGPPDGPPSEKRLGKAARLRRPTSDQAVCPRCRQPED